MLTSTRLASFKMKLQVFVIAFFLLNSLDSWGQEESRFAEFELVYSSLPWYNLKGGFEQGFVYMDNVDITTRLNFGKLLVGEDDHLSLFLYGLGNAGGRASSLMGDFQAASNIEAPKSWRLFEAWLQQNLFDDEVSILVGLYDLNSEFDVLRPGTVFINSSFGIGAEYAQSGLNGPSIFPISSLGVRFSSTLGDKGKFRLAILDGVSGDPENPRSNKISLSKKDGALIALETAIYSESKSERRVHRDYVTRRRKVGREHDIPTNDKLNVGGWYYTSRFENIADTTQNHRNWGAYLGVQKYWFLFSELDKYLSVFMRYGIAHEKVNRFGSALSGGVVLADRFSNYLGLAISSGFHGDSFQYEQIDNYQNETVIELTYSWRIKNFLTLQPDIQYVLNPGFGVDLDNPLSAAIMVQLSFNN